MLHFALFVEHVDGHEDHTEPQAREKDVEKVHAVGKLDQQAIAGLQPAGFQRGRHAIGARVHFAECQLVQSPVGRLVFETDNITPSLERQAEEVGELHDRGHCMLPLMRPLVLLFAMTTLVSAQSVQFLPIQPELFSTAGAFVNAWADYDGDDDPDLFVGFNGTPNRLYRNTRGTFEDIAASAGLADSRAVRAAAWGDIH